MGIAVPQIPLRRAWKTKDVPKTIQKRSLRERHSMNMVIQDTLDQTMAGLMMLLGFLLITSGFFPTIPTYLLGKPM
jgi:hypothetical protein